MTSFHSNLDSDKSNKMKKWAIFGITAVIVAGAVIWTQLHGKSDTSQPAQATANVDTSQHPSTSGRQWFSNIEVKAPIAKTMLLAADEDGQGLDLHGLTVSQYVKSQYDAANKGDAKAAYKIYEAETVCTNLSKQQRDLANLPLDTNKNIVGALESVIKNSQAACADFNISPKERLDYLHTAAQGGNVMALLMSAREAPEGIDPSKPLDLTDPRAVQWQKDSLNYMTQAAAKGNVVAMMGLSTVYEQGGRWDRPISLWH